jgi:hypothetical protein
MRRTLKRTLVTAFFSLTAATAALAHSETAFACSSADWTTARNHLENLEKRLDYNRIEEAEASYQLIGAMDPTCITREAHEAGSRVALRLGRIHETLMRLTATGTYANAPRRIAEINARYGVVRVTQSPTARTPRVLTRLDPGGFTLEAARARDIFIAKLQEDGRAVGYLPPGTYRISSGAATLAVFTVVAGQTTFQTY